MAASRNRGQNEGLVGTFIVTREHRRFTEFADALRRYRYIGVCHGAAGVGKTLSARRYTHWDMALSLINDWGPREASDAKIYAELSRSRTVFYAPTVGLTLRELRHDLPLLLTRTNICIEQHIHPESTAVKGSTVAKTIEGVTIQSKVVSRRPKHVELLIIDEAERLSMTALDYLRDLFDRDSISLILIGMLGIDKRLSRYPQLFSRVGFLHTYRPLQNEELTFVLTRR